MSRALILDFDGSVKPMPEAETISLTGWQETIRFACRKEKLHELGRELAPILDARPTVVFPGSGDYHHVSYLLVELLRPRDTRIQVVVFDNHPDNMRYPFGIHCGSWVWHASRLPFVSRVLVVGITSRDVEAGRLWENHLTPLFSGKVAYFCVQRNLRMLNRLGIRNCRSFPSMAALLEELPSTLAAAPEPVYLSIDKDVLADDIVRTNWDQGVLRLEELTTAIRMLQGRTFACDVVGDVSSYRYRSPFKRFLSGLDRQPEIPLRTLGDWQEQHQRINRHLLSILAP